MDEIGTALYRSEGTEATCPKCHGGNAMLTGSDWDGEELSPFAKCRDCGFKVETPEIITVSYEDLKTRYKFGKDRMAVDLEKLKDKIRRANRKLNKLQNTYKKETGQIYNGFF